MRRSVWKFLILLVLWLGCRQGRKDVPLNETDLVNLLVDIHIAEAAIQDLYGSIKGDVGQIYYEQVFQKYDFNHELFDSTMSIIRRNPEYASRIYKKVMEELDEKQEELHKN